MPDKVIIRQYQSKDESSVRKICADTANRGNPAESFLKDRDLVADLITLYYTQYEPASLWVAQVDNEVVGYVTGCVNHRQYLSNMSWPIVPKAIIKAIFRGTLFQRETWSLIWAALKSFFKGGFERKVPFNIYPVHLHIDIANGFRGKSIGKKLMDQFVEQVRREGFCGIHAAVREDNESGCKFFEKMGFTVVSKCRVFLPCDSGFCLKNVLLYGRKINA